MPLFLSTDAKHQEPNWADDSAEEKEHQARLWREFTSAAASGVSHIDIAQMTTEVGADEIANYQNIESVLDRRF